MAVVIKIQSTVHSVLLSLRLQNNSTLPLLLSTAAVETKSIPPSDVNSVVDA